MQTAQVLERIAAAPCYGFFEGFDYRGKQDFDEYSTGEESNIDCYELQWGT